jgi:hypothetical protein
MPIIHKCKRFSLNFHQESLLLLRVLVELEIVKFVSGNKVNNKLLYVFA